MDPKYNQEMIQKSVKKKFKGHQTLNAKVAPLYPSALESQYQGVVNAYMKILNRVVSKHLPRIKKAAEAEREVPRRADDLNSLMSAIQAAFADMAKDLDLQTEQFDLYGKLEALANQSQKLSIRQWKRIIGKTLGLDLADDYYLGQFFQQLLDQWVSENVSLIKTIPQGSLEEMREIVYNGYRTGQTTTSIVKEIQHTYSVNKSHARLIARDQMAKLNAELTKRQQTDAGVESYKWSTSRDSRVREGHRRLNGKIFRWDDPPVVDAKTGRRCHPGEDYQCRCVAIPVFNISTLNVPASPGKGGD